jgi:hypothetical protein
VDSGTITGRFTGHRKIDQHVADLEVQLQNARNDAQRSRRDLRAALVIAARLA